MFYREKFSHGRTGPPERANFYFFKFKIMSRKFHFSDHLEREIAMALDNKGIRYIHESEKGGPVLDFYLPDFDVYIEIKQFHSDRINRQLASRENVVLLQGKKAVDFFKTMLNQQYL